MSTGSRPGPQGKKKGTPHATYLQVKNAGSAAAYKAGPLHGVYGHRTHAHQPCARIITEGEMPCPYCQSGLDPVWRGYLPLWDRDWALRYVLIGEEYCETVDVIGHRTQVILTRHKNPISPLVVREESTLDRELPTKSPWSDTIDMEAICLDLWKHPCLKEWVMTHRPARSVDPEGVPLTSTGEPYSPMTKAAARKVSRKQATEAAEKSFDAVVNRLARSASQLPTSTNGHHG